MQSNAKSERVKDAAKFIMTAISAVSLVLTLAHTCSRPAPTRNAEAPTCIVCVPKCEGKTKCNTATGTCEGTATHSETATHVIDDRVGAPETDKDFYMLQIAVPKR